MIVPDRSKTQPTQTSLDQSTHPNTPIHHNQPTRFKIEKATLLSTTFLVTFKPNSSSQTPIRYYENSIQIDASATIVERCFTDLDLMHRWLNPALRCRPIGDWSTDLGARSRFTIAIPLLEPSLYSTVVERSPGMIVWEFTGFFLGRDQWECRPNAIGTQLMNRFSFEIPNPLIRFGFDTFAARLTQSDMQKQLRRLKAIAEREYLMTH